MKKRIWNQLKKAVMITAAVGILGAGAVSAAEFEAAELYVPAVGLKQSAQWIDEEKFQAELTLEVSGLKELYKSQQENTVSENGQLQMENSTWDGEVREAEAAENTTDEVDSENTECESESAVIDIEDIESEEYRKAEENAEGSDTETGNRVVISHSNGPQVGMIHTAMNEFGKTHPDYTFAPMSVCSAMSQGYIGYDLQTAIRAELISRGIYKPVATILTQVVIDPYDDAFAEPEKIIGRVLTEEEAETEESKGNFVTKLADGTYKRILAAPKPQKIVELETIRTLVDAGQVVIAAGGGGIPVMEQGIDLHGASAIIEKDLSSGLLAQELNADTLLILTSVEKVSLNLGQDNEEYLNTISVDDAKKYMADNQFAPGSMLPKFEAGISFIEKGDNRRTIITDIAHAKDGYFEKTGTIIK